MRFLRFFLFALPFFAFTTVHKYYVSVTEVNYIKEQQSIQITSRLFIDDFEKALKQNYSQNIILAEKDEAKVVDFYIKKYLKESIELVVNGTPSSFHFIGKAYEGDIVKCYLEVESIKNITSFFIRNKTLFDLEKGQKNIIKMNINSKNKSVILTHNNSDFLLKFN